MEERDQTQPVLQNQWLGKGLRPHLQSNPQTVTVVRGQRQRPSEPVLTAGLELQACQRAANVSVDPELEGWKSRAEHITVM